MTQNLSQKNPAVNRIVSVVVAFITNQLSANVSKSPPGFIIFWAHVGILNATEDVNPSIVLQTKIFRAKMFAIESVENNLNRNTYSNPNSFSTARVSYT